MSSMKNFGYLLLILGGAGLFYFFLVFDPTVEVDITASGFSSQPIGSPSGGIVQRPRVNNIGLMADRQNGLIVSGVIAGLGMLLVLFGTESRVQSAEKKCPYCAEYIKQEATVCRFCGRDVVSGSVAQSAPPTPDGTWVCRCGHTNEPGVTACANCKRAPNAVI